MTCYFVFTFEELIIISFINRCDQGFDGDFCVASTPLPKALKDDFNTPKVKPTVWGEVFGGSNSQACGALVTDKALTFNEVGPVALFEYVLQVFLKTLFTLL